MASGPISSWQIDGEAMETVKDYFLGLQNHCRWRLQPWNLKILAPWKKTCDQPKQPIKNRDITLLTKVHLVKAMVFPVVMYGRKSWTIKKAECWKVDAFELWCWRRLLSIPWTSRRSNQSILKEISPENSLKWPMLKLKPVLWPPDVKNWLTGKDPGAGEDWRQEKKGTTQDKTIGRHHWLNGHKFEQVSGAGDGQGSLACCSPWGCRVGHDWVTELNFLVLSSE